MCLFNIAYHRLIGLENNLSISTTRLYLSIAHSFYMHVESISPHTHTYIIYTYTHTYIYQHTQFDEKKSPGKIFRMSFHSMFLFLQTVLWGILFPDIILLPIISGKEQLLMTTVYSLLINGGCCQSLLFLHFYFVALRSSCASPSMVVPSQATVTLADAQQNPHGQLSQPYCYLTELFSGYHQFCESLLTASRGWHFMFAYRMR